MSKTNSMLCVLLLAAVFSFAQDQSSDKGGKVVLPEGLSLIPHAYAHMEAGEIEQGSLKNDDIATNNGNYGIDHVWTEDADLEGGFTAIYKDRLKMEFSLGAKLYFSYPVFLGHDQYTKYLRQDIYFDQAYAQYHLGDAAMPLFLAQVGYFKFKYNPEVVNLGEYMFRTGTYPIWFNMGFDTPWQRLLGFHVQDNFFKSLKIDLLLTSATVWPTMNWALAALANYDIAALHFINIGAGVDFEHLFDVYTDRYFGSGTGDPTQPKSGNYNAQYIQNGDTLWYTFKGTKVMGRITIDPKAFFHSKIFGENDLKLYAEADLIGVENYPDSGLPQGSPTLTLVAPSYNKWQEKMPIAIGFYFPTFKVLDALDGEIEWFGAKYYNDASNQFGKGSEPLPYSVQVQLTDPNAPVKSQIKWSVYAKKSFFDGHFAITGQIGRDHMTLPCAAYSYEYWNELLVTANDWWWILKTSWMF
ncbi:MAG TPA: hypothetical protein VLX68_07380 [Chitinivibrionales bacterium]|nr:hypothetical protein [Chitinivibrionales bacterium]